MGHALRLTLALIAALSAGTITATAGTIYVSKIGNDVSSGMTWATAKLTVQASLNAATSGDQVWVAAGTYIERITLKDGVELYGGFVGNEIELTQRNWIAHATVIDGNRSGVVVTASTGVTASARIDGFTICNGKGSSGGGIICVSASPVICNNTISGNISDNGNGGGGIFCSAGSPVISHNIITGNSTTSNGGGIMCQSSGLPVIFDNTISGNVANIGGGIYCLSTSNIFNNNITGNSAATGGGIACQYSTSTISNNTIAGNNAITGGGIYCSSTPTTICNNLIAFNSSGLYQTGATLTLRSNCVYNPGGINYSGTSAGIGDISVDPQFVAAEFGAYHLKAGSPCIDAGADDVVQPDWVDIDGGPRIQDAHVDIGADEFSGAVPSFTPIIVHVSPSGNDANNGLTWATAKHTVQSGINVCAQACGGEVWCAAGTYNELVTMKMWTHVFGGFAGSEGSRNQRNWSTNTTILDGGGGGSVIVASAPGYCSSTIDGFTIRKGTGTLVSSSHCGGGIYCSYSSPTISNNTITGNVVDNNGGGGGIYCSYASPLILNNTISGNISGAGGGVLCRYSSPAITGNTIAGNNSIGTYGGGIRCYSSSPTISNNTITENSGGGIYTEMQSDAKISGNTIRGNIYGGIYCSSSSAAISNNLVTGNSTTSTGGGIYCSSSTVSISNNTITSNSASIGGGILCSSSKVSICNNTITGNSAPTGGGIHSSSSAVSTVKINNNIIALNSSGIYNSGAGTTLSNNCVHNPGGTNYSGLSAGTGDMSVDPHLVAGAYGEAHLTSDSPCIDWGLDSVVQPDWSDIDGQLRIQGVHVDIGADEFDGTSPTFTPKIVRVSPLGNDANDGSDWTLPKRTVQAAINLAAQAGGGEVWVDAGTYNEHITLQPWVHVYGGFTGTENNRSGRNWVTNVAIIDGSANGSVVTSTAAGYASSAIDGFTIRNGAGTVSGSVLHGGGVYCYYASPRVANNKLIGNSSDGIYCSSSTPLIENNEIVGNSGRGIWAASSSPVISGNTVGTNTGGGIYLFSSSGVIFRNRVYANSTSYGGGIACYSSTPVIYSNIISANSATYGGGVYCNHSPTKISNNTITGNSGAGVYSELDPTVISNNIVAFNSSGLHGASTLRSNCVYNPGGANYTSLNAGIGDISVDPQLVAAEYGEVHLRPGSPCIDVGLDEVVQSDWVDLDGEARIQGSHVDIGADEFNGAPPLFTPTIIYVSPSGNDGNDGSTWATAKRMLQAGIDAASNARGEVWVSAGTYNERVTLKPLAQVYGGFTGSESTRGQRNWKTNLTILDGDDAGSVVTAVGGHRVSRIDGFTIRNGSGTPSGSLRNGGGIYCSSASPMIYNNTITGNTASGSGNGGGIYCSSPSAPEIVSNVIIGNEGFKGGGIYCDSSSPLISGNTITANIGTGISCTSGSPTVSQNLITDNNGSGLNWFNQSSSAISGNVIIGNHTTYGGGIYCYNSSPAIFNNSIMANSANTYGGGIYCGTYASPSICNNTVIANSAGSNGGAFSCSGSSSPTIANNLIAFNSSGLYQGSGTPTLRNNCIYNPAGANYTGVIAGSGDISVDPHIVSEEYGAFHLKDGSPCIDAGLDSVVQAGWTDIDSEARLQGAHVDIGADEFDGTTPQFTPSIVRVSGSGTDTNDGLTWATAKRTVQAAIDAAAGLGGEVWVGAGTYNERISLKTFAYLYGGFAGTETDRDQRDWAINATVLDGGAAGSVVTCLSGHRVSRIDGFTIRNGSGTLVGSYRYGGGIYCSGASPIICNNAISENSVSTTGYGGGICLLDSCSGIMNNRIIGNLAKYGGGVYCTAARPTVSNNSICANSAGSGGGAIYSYSSSPSISNNILAFNSSGIYVSAGTTTLRNNCIYGTSGANYTGVVAGVGDISRDPLFVNRATGDYHLAAGSPCIDAGYNEAIPPGTLTDLNGYSRFFDVPTISDCRWSPGNCGTAPIVDMGAYEFIPTIPGDFDHDGDVDLEDIGTFQACILGPAVPYSGDCGKADFDKDGDVDQSDFGFFQRCFGGTVEPVDPNCSN